MNLSGQNRLKSIDDFRGITIALMFLANFIILFTSEPPLIFSHAQNGMTLPLDLVAPFFGFAMGLSIPFLRDKVTTVQFKKRLLKRVILLYIIGKAPNFFYRLYFFEKGIAAAFLNSWSILETWALGFIIISIIINLNVKFRLGIALVLLFIYQILLLYSKVVLNYVNSMAEGGLIAVLSWAFLIILGTIVSDIIKINDKKLLLHKGLFISIFFSLMGLILHYGEIILMERMLVSASYILFSAGLAIILFLFFYFKAPGFGVIFRNIGKYPLQAWILQSIFYIPVYLTIGSSYFEWPVGGIFALIGVIILILLDELLLNLGVKIKV